MTERKPNRPIPEKLRRMRSAYGALRARARELDERRLRLIAERRKVQHERDRMANRSLSYPVTEAKEQRARDLAAIDSEIAAFDDQIKSIDSDIAPIRADWQALARTVRALQAHLGIDDDDEMIRPNNFRVTA